MGWSLKFASISSLHCWQTLGSFCSASGSSELNPLGFQREFILVWCCFGHFQNCTLRLHISVQRWLTHQNSVDLSFTKLTILSVCGFHLAQVRSHSSEMIRLSRMVMNHSIAHLEAQRCASRTTVLGADNYTQRALPPLGSFTEPESIGREITANVKSGKTSYGALLRPGQRSRCGCEINLCTWNSMMMISIQHQVDS